MNVYEFEKSLFERLEESCNVLQCKDSPVSASDVREEWACHVELKIEPAGWQAIWKMNRATCEQFNVKYPTVVLGTVNNVYFQDLMADFAISAVQDDDVHLPEIHEVPLEDLWPTIDQENSALNIERTADCLDELRFFYRNVWMPWDSDSDEENDWCKKHLESRIRFCFDLKRGMSRGMADHVRKLLAEARYIQNKREIMELEMSDDEDAEEDPEKINGFMRMQLRLIEIRNEMEMLENPVFRRTYEDLHFKVKSNNNNVKYDQKANVYVVTKEDTFTKQMEFFDAAKRLIGADEVIKFAPSLMDCLKICVPRDSIYLPCGRHSIKWLEPLNSGGLLKAVSQTDNKNILDNFALESKQRTIITTDESDNVFLSFSGDYTIENVILDCRLVRFGIWNKSGTITLKNCQLIGDRKSSTGIGIVIAGDAKCVLENTQIQNFATGISCASGGKLVMNNSIISKCGTGVETNDTSKVQMDSSQMLNSDYALLLKTKTAKFANGEKKKIVANFSELREFMASLDMHIDCMFSDNKKGNIVIVDQKNMVSLQHAEYLEDNYEETGFTNTDVSMANGKILTNGHTSPIVIDEADETINSNALTNQSYHQNSNANISIISID